MITHANSILGFSLPPIFSKQKENNNINSMLKEQKSHKLTEAEFMTMLPLDVDLGLCHGDSTPQRSFSVVRSSQDFPLHCIPFCCAGLARSPSATVFTPISPATVISGTFPTDRRELWAVTLWISRTWILSVRRSPGELSSLPVSWFSEMLKSTKIFVFAHSVESVDG